MEHRRGLEIHPGSDARTEPNRNREVEAGGLIDPTGLSRCTLWEKLSRPRWREFRFSHASNAGAIAASGDQAYGLRSLHRLHRDGRCRECQRSR